MSDEKRPAREAHPDRNDSEFQVTIAIPTPPVVAAGTATVDAVVTLQFNDAELRVAAITYGEEPNQTTIHCQPNGRVAAGPANVYRPRFLAVPINTDLFLIAAAVRTTQTGYSVHRFNINFHVA